MSDRVTLDERLQLNGPPEAVAYVAEALMVATRNMATAAADGVAQAHTLDALHGDAAELVSRQESLHAVTQRLADHWCAEHQRAVRGLDDDAS